MFGFLARLFYRSSSSETARKRLKFVLLSDHLALAPDVIDAMRAELLAVIARYCDIDPSCAEVGFEHREQGIEMHATVPIRALTGRQRPDLKVVRPSAQLSQAAPVVAAEAPASTVASELPGIEWGTQAPLLDEEPSDDGAERKSDETATGEKSAELEKSAVEGNAAEPASKTLPVTRKKHQKSGRTYPAAPSSTREHVNGERSAQG
ncbi:MAG TPA: cell division topological specificity factor MinE [Candidatus Baltobacteraceae bacterium]|jgi:cell division topological specificity factor|nr:cell division topological specificity factor MinE [Candidatus Baltobacteraceae bacterium]